MPLPLPHPPRTSAVALIALLGLLPALASGQCPVREITLSGQIVDAAGEALAGARVTATWEERAAGRVSNRRITDADGRFALPITFDTFSGRSFLGEQQCQGELVEIALSASLIGYTSINLNVEASAADTPIPIVLARQ